MNIGEVPQDQKNFRDGNHAPKKVMYVTGTDGHYTQTQSVGWEPENLALEQAWEEIEQQLQELEQQMKRGECSPVPYYMVKNRMDLPILASYVGKWQWQVKRHFKPSVFRNLSDTMLQRYADVFHISVQELKQAGGQK